MSLSSLEPPKPVPQQTVLPADGLFESQAKTDLFSASSVSKKKTQPPPPHTPPGEFVTSSPSCKPYQEVLQSSTGSFYKRLK